MCENQTTVQGLLRHILHERFLYWFVCFCLSKIYSGTKCTWRATSTHRPLPGANQPGLMFCVFWVLICALTALLVVVRFLYLFTILGSRFLVNWQISSRRRSRISFLSILFISRLLLFQSRCR